ncbi:hypothetical protein BDZ89DRAFT_1135375 [Hymenopellis radicata]|nr:hypothetical protein BDZ89DRAFT_1135375 [Hymenopellis radicata]
MSLATFAAQPTPRADSPAIVTNVRGLSPYCQTAMSDMPHLCVRALRILACTTCRPSL